MRTKLLLIVLSLVLFGTLTYCGFQFWESNKVAFYLVEGAAVVGVLLLLVIYRKLLKPYQTLVNSIDMLKGQDFSSRLRPVGNSEADRLIELFNAMMSKLKRERLSVREKNHFLDLLINASPQGVIILDFDYNITSLNPAAQRFMGVESADEVVGRELSECDQWLCRQLSALEPEVDKIVKSGGAKQYRCRLSSFIDQGFPHPFILVEELTYELLRAEKSSYENVIRMMSHEVNNSLGAINATLGVVEEIAQEEPHLEEVLPAIEASSERSRHLVEFVSRLAEVVKIPKPTIVPTELNELVRSVATLVYGECRAHNVELELNLAEEGCLVELDGVQFEHVLLNIVKNGYEAIDNGGTISITTQCKPPRVTIANNGKPLTPEESANLFTPFYTTKPKGDGVGLMFVREVLLNHNFAFDLYTAEGWTRFDIYL